MSLQAAALYATVSVAGADRSVREFGRVSNSADAAQRRLTVLGRTSGGVGKGVGQMLGGVARIAAYTAGAVIAAGTASTAVAVNFQDVFAGVKKTVEGTPAELDMLNGALKRLSTRIPVSFADLAGIATEAGALNVATADVDKFTEAVARTSAATVGLDKAMAAEAFGKLGTIFALHGKDYERLGSVLVELGRNGASTEADIIAVTQRFAAAGQQAGLSAAQVLGWSSALASLGPEAEAAGGALQRTFNKATQNIALMDQKDAKGRNAKKRVEAFARVSGMTVKEFVDLYTRDASAAMEQFVGGLADKDKFEVAREFVKAGIINQRDLYALASFANRQEVLTAQLGLSNKAWAANTALVDVSTTRFDTLKAKLTELKNTALLGADAFGSELLPALGRVAAKGKDLILAHMGDFRTYGREVGAAIDSIDWSRVEGGIRTVVDLTRGLLDIIRQIPAEVSIGFAGLVGLDKLAGGLLGRGAGNVVGGIFNQFLARGASPANPMWVQSVAGLGGPGGVPPVAGLGPGLVAAGAALPFALAGLSATAAYSANEREFGGKGMTEAEIRAIKWDRMSGEARYTSTMHGYGRQADQDALLTSALKKMGISSLAGKAADDVIRGLGGTERHLGKAADDLAAVSRVLGAVGSEIRKSLASGILGPQTRAEFRAAMVKARGKDFAIGSLRTGPAAKDMPTVDYLTRMFLVSQAPFYKNMGNVERAIDAMKAAQARALAHGDTKTAAKIADRIKTLQAILHGDLNQVKSAVKSVAPAVTVNNQPAPVNLYIDGKRVAGGLLRYLPGRIT